MSREGKKIWVGKKRKLSWGKDIIIIRRRCGYYHFWGGCKNFLLFERGGGEPRKGNCGFGQQVKILEKKLYPLVKIMIIKTKLIICKIIIIIV